jgi:hypothetical protein
MCVKKDYQTKRITTKKNQLTIVSFKNPTNRFQMKFIIGTTKKQKVDNLNK